MVALARHQFRIGGPDAPVRVSRSGDSAFTTQPRFGVTVCPPALNGLALFFRKMYCAAMINANVVKGIHDLLAKRGMHQKDGEEFGSFVTRALGVSAHQAETLLTALDEGASTEEALARAEIEMSTIDRDLLMNFARSIGTALGELKNQIAR